MGVHGPGDITGLEEPLETLQHGGEPIRRHGDIVEDADRPRRAAEPHQPALDRPPPGEQTIAVRPLGERRRRPGERSGALGLLDRHADRLGGAQRNRVPRIPPPAPTRRLRRSHRGRADPRPGPVGANVGPEVARAGNPPGAQQPRRECRRLREPLEGQQEHRRAPGSRDRAQHGLGDQGQRTLRAGDQPGQVDAGIVRRPVQGVADAVSRGGRAGPMEPVRPASVQDLQLADDPLDRAGWLLLRDRPGLVSEIEALAAGQDHSQPLDLRAPIEPYRIERPPAPSTAIIPPMVVTSGSRGIGSSRRPTFASCASS